MLQIVQEWEEVEVCMVGKLGATGGGGGGREVESWPRITKTHGVVEREKRSW